MKTKERNTPLNYKQTLEALLSSLGIVRVKRFIFQDESSLRLDRFLFQRAIDDVSRMVHLSRFRFYCFASFHSWTPFAFGCNSFFFSFLLLFDRRRRWPYLWKWCNQVLCSLQLVSLPTQAGIYSFSYYSFFNLQRVFNFYAILRKLN